MNNSFYTRQNTFSNIVPNYDDFYNNNNNLNNYNNSSTNNSYAQNVLQKNIGMSGYFFVSFPDSVDWRDKIFYGILKEAGDDYVLIYNEDNHEYYLIWSIYLNYATFNQKPNT